MTRALALAYNAAMIIEDFAWQERERLGRRLTGIYCRALLWYLLGMLGLWLVGVESIYLHPTPFYALFMPAFNLLAVPLAVAACFGWAWLWLSRRHVARGWLRVSVSALAWGMLAAVPLAVHLLGAPGRGESVGSALGLFLYFMCWHLLALAAFLGFAVALLRLLARVDWFGTEPSSQFVRRFLLGLICFSVLFACGIAMLRDGPHGISQAFARQTLEVTGDIGKARSMVDMVRRYVDLQPYLSVHGRCHPPGPILLEWFFSYFVGQGAMGLSLATVIFGALAVVPMYLWVAEIFTKRAGLTAAMIYALVPSVLLFQATSADTLFPPFTLATLWLFERAIRRRSLRYAALAGLGYGCMGMLKYSLFGVGAYFAFAGLWWLGRREYRAVIQTAVVMGGVTAAFHLALRFGLGFDLMESMRLAKEFVDSDRMHERTLAPRYGFWAWRFLNPLCWLYFAGIPVSILFLRRLWHTPRADRGYCWIMALTALVQCALYLGAGEGERSALYIFPFLVVPAAHAVDAMGERIERHTPLLATLAFLAFQCWLTESYFFTYW